MAGACLRGALLAGPVLMSQVYFMSRLQVYFTSCPGAAGQGTVPGLWLLYISSRRTAGGQGRGALLRVLREAPGSPAPEPCPAGGSL